MRPDRPGRRWITRLAAALAIWPALAAAAQPYAGIYVATPLLLAGRPAPAAEPYVSPAVDGVFARLVWSAVEPAPGRFDWSSLDPWIDRALASGKSLEIAVIAGAFTPRWVFETGVPGADFVVAPHGGRNGHCRTVTLPAPWSPAYQADYAAVMNALAAHLKARPGAYQAVRIIKLSGVNEHSEETRMPAASGAPAAPGGCAESGAVAAWTGLGYRPSKIVAAFTALAGAAGRAFPDKLMAMAILEGNQFPPIDETGQVQSGRGSSAAVRDAMIDWGIKAFPGRFAVQWNGLQADKVSPAVLSAGRRGAIVGWQSNEHAGQEGGADCPTATDPRAACDEAGYEALLRNGIAQHGRFIEIWPADVLKFPMPVLRAGEALKGR